MSDHSSPTDASPSTPDALARLVQALVDQLAATNAAWNRVERQAIPLLERIAVALERGAVGPSAGANSTESSVADEVRAAIVEGHWDRAEAAIDGLKARDGSGPEAEALAVEMGRARERASADWTDRIAAARLVNDADGAIEARDELAKILRGDALKAVDRELIGWLMKLIQRRLRSIPVGSDLAALASKMADRFGGTPEGASLRAALPTLRRSAGLCPRCSEPYSGVDDACPKCLAAAGQTPSVPPTLTFVSGDELDSMVEESSPVDLNNAEIWQLPRSSEAP